MDAIEVPGPHSTLCSAYQACYHSFGRFELALRSDGCRVVHLNQLKLDKVLEEYGKLKIWGHQAHAELPSSARGSLEDILRHDEQLKQLTSSILMRLTQLLHQGKRSGQYRRST